MFNSFLSIISEKKYSVDIKKINGKISKSIEGELSNVKKTGKVKFTPSTFLKKLTSSNILRIIVIQKKITVTIPKLLKKELIKFF